MPRKPVSLKGVYERPAGSGNWSVRYWAGAKWVRKAFGKDKEAAIAYAAKALLIRKNGEGVLPTSAREHVLTFAEVKQRESTLTVAEIADEYLAHVKAHPEQYRDQVNPIRVVTEVKKAFGSRSAAAIQPHHVDDWLDQLAAERNLKPASVNRYKATFSGIYSRAVQRSRVPLNPVRSVKQRRVNNGVIRYLEPDEETRLRAAIAAHAESKSHLAQYQPRWVEHRLCELTFALGTGTRKSEQYKLRWADIDMKGRQILLKDTKNGETRKIEMIDDVHAALLTLRELNVQRRDGKIDPETGERREAPKGMVFALGDNKKWWAQALKDAKITDFRWHDLRHTFCSRLAMAGVSLKVIQEAAGHKTIQMTARYAHLDRSTMRTALAVLNRDK